MHIHGKKSRPASQFRKVVIITAAAWVCHILRKGLSYCYASANRVLKRGVKIRIARPNMGLRFSCHQLYGNILFSTLKIASQVDKPGSLQTYEELDFRHAVHSHCILESIRMTICSVSQADWMEEERSLTHTHQYTDKGLNFS